ncbi:hypothetical protein ACHAXT_010827 [Thalassiosira profunda]
MADLPIVRAHEFVVPGDSSYSFWRYRILEHVQHSLIEESEKDDVHLNREDRRGGRRTTHFGDSYHERILPHWEAFAAMKERMGGMQSFKMKEISLPPAPFFAEKLLPALASSNDTLVQLDLVCCKLGSSGFACVAEFLTDNASLTALDISINTINDVDDAKFLALAIWNHPALLFVNLSQCSIGKTQGVLSEVMGGAGNLETLLLDHNYIRPEGMALVADFLATNTVMTTLSVAENSQYNLTAEERSVDAADAIGKALKKNTSLRELNLFWCNGLNRPTFLGSRRATDLLTYLNLGGNRIGKEYGEMIANYLARNPALVELNLRWNGLASRAVKLIAEALKSNDTLRHLDLGCNNLGDRSVPFLADMLRHNSTLRTLKLIYAEIQIKSGARKKLINALCDTSSLNAIVESNHTCQLFMSSSCFGDTCELEMRKINALEDEGQKIRYKVVLALFAFDKDLFSPRSFDDVPLELMPRLLHLVQQEIGYGGFGEGIAKKMRKRRKNRFDPTLRRVHKVISGWNQLPLLFVRGPGVLKKKRKRKRHVMSYKDDEDEDWTPGSR